MFLISPILFFLGGETKMPYPSVFFKYLQNEGGDKNALPFGFFEISPN